MAQGKKAKPSYVYVIIGISLVLFLLGTLGWLVINGRGLSRVFKEDIEVEVILHDNTREEKMAQLKTILDHQPFTRETRIITKEQAIQTFKDETGEDPTELLAFNPLYPSIILNLRSGYVNRDSIEKIRQFVMQSNIVRDISYPDVVIENINRNFRQIGLILGSISLILFIVVVFLIDNTVRLAMFSNRFLIKTMQMVGATRWFITRPFDRRAILNGLIGGIIAIIGLWMVISLAEAKLPSLKALHEPAWLAVLMTGMAMVGVMISVLSTHRAVLKYLKTHIEDLY